MGRRAWGLRHGVLELDPAGSRNRGLLSLMRRHRCNLKPEQLARLMDYLAGQPALALIYRFKQRLCSLLLKKNRSRKQCQPLAARFLKAVHQLGETLYNWRNEIALMWRFTRNNGITEGFHTRMELINRQAYGFRNFNNYRMRVKVLCA